MPMPMPTLLVVDDVATDRLRIAGLAARWMNSNVLQAADGATALKMIEQHQPDIVLTDLHMPEMNGLQLVEAIRDQYPYIPVILMTADGSEEIAALALQKGAASYVPKRNLAQNLNGHCNKCMSLPAILRFSLKSCTRFSPRRPS